MGRVRRKKDFSHMEPVDGRMVNVLQGLELHTAVFSPDEQKRIVDCVHDLQDRGRRGLLRGYVGACYSQSLELVLVAALSIFRFRFRFPEQA